MADLKSALSDFFVHRPRCKSPGALGDTPGTSRTKPGTTTTQLWMKVESVTSVGSGPRVCWEQGGRVLGTGQA